MNEFEQVKETENKIINILNESKLTGMTMYYMLGDLQNMVKQQITNAGVTQNDSEVQP